MVWTQTTKMYLVTIKYCINIINNWTINVKYLSTQSHPSKTDLQVTHIVIMHLNGGH